MYTQNNPQINQKPPQCCSCCHHQFGAIVPVIPTTPSHLTLYLQNTFGYLKGQKFKCHFYYRGARKFYRVCLNFLKRYYQGQVEQIIEEVKITYRNLHQIQNFDMSKQIYNESYFKIFVSVLKKYAIDIFRLVQFMKIYLISQEQKLKEISKKIFYERMMKFLQIFTQDDSFLQTIRNEIMIKKMRIQSRK